MTDAELREQLNSFDIHDKQCGVATTRDLGNCDCNMDEFYELITARDAAIRIDELDKMERLVNTQPVDSTGSYSKEKIMRDWIKDRKAIYAQLRTSDLVRPKGEKEQ